MRPAWFSIRQVTGDLENTSKKIQDVLPSSMREADLTRADLGTLYTTLFLCKVCGWWVHRAQESERNETCKNCEGDTVD